ncbi:MAG: hypothetical protein DRR06_02070 [Gammaproteobacteria bacterium]|nr:MAG: hypothetical protein DRR06_02070 [Gammaproteobacteria bacterium]RLA53933.1 MAG: hypothetical protein DRR42_03410 [Gammaproteobacteria bacterium]
MILKTLMPAFLLPVILFGCNGQSYHANSSSASTPAAIKASPSNATGTATAKGSSTSFGGDKSKSAETTLKQAITNTKILTSKDLVASDTDTGKAKPEKMENLWVQLANNQHFADNGAHPRIDRYLRRYTNNQAYFDRTMKRAFLYMPYISAQIKERGLPAELVLLPFIESAYNPFAYSSGGAAGLWQFMPSTAKALGLTRSSWYDGRRDVIASTKAALTYLEYLHKRFDGDWLIALAAYNGGEGRLSRAIRENRSKGLKTDYWSLNLSKETEAYIPHFLALTRVITNTGTYGVNIPHLDNDINFSITKLEKPIDLQRAAKLAGIEVDTLYMLNPGLLRKAIPPSGSFNLILPTRAATTLKARSTSGPGTS